MAAWGQSSRAQTLVPAPPVSRHELRHPAHWLAPYLSGELLQAAACHRLGIPMLWELRRDAKTIATNDLGGDKPAHHLQWFEIIPITTLTGGISNN